MAFTSKNPKVNTTILNDYGSAGTPTNPAAGGHAVVNRSGSLFMRNSAGVEVPMSGVSVITQSSHGFVSTDYGCPVYINGSGVYVKAKADVSTTAEVAGLISYIIDTNNFVLSMMGNVTVDSSQSGGALTVGSTYYLSATTAGQITATEPSTLGQVSKPVGVAKTTSALEFFNMRGVVVGGVNARTNISLANNATTTVQNVSAYTAGQLTGWISIVATTPLNFYVAAEFVKNGAGTDYYIAYQTSGDTAPTGFSVTVTSAGVIQVTLPSITGFTSAAINYALNAPAVGTTLPLSINSATTTQAGVVRLPDTQIRLDTDNGYGSTNTTVWRFTNVTSTTGSGATLTQSASLGDSITVNVKGIYAISYTQDVNNAAEFGITLNATGYLSTQMGAGIPASVKLQSSQNPVVSAQRTGFVGWTGILNSGDVIRFQGDTTVGSNVNRTQVTFTQVVLL